MGRVLEELKWLLLAKFAKPIMDYFKVPEYYDGDDYLKQFGEKSLTQVLRLKYPDFGRGES